LGWKFGSKKESAELFRIQLLTFLHVTFSWLARILVALQCFVNFTVHPSRFLVYTIYKLENFISKDGKSIWSERFGAYQDSSIQIVEKVFKIF
jgi:hypothetical protein